MDDARGPSRLVVVGTPIGNLGDLAPRAEAALAHAEVIACEDTRRTGRLLSLLGLAVPKLVRLDEHTEVEVSSRLIDLVRSGTSVVVVSDAGLPALSDPGGRIVAAAAEVGVVIEVIPGPFAGAVAAVASGLLDPSGRFVFEGFLPRKGSTRSARIAALSDEMRTVVFYEAPHRLARTMSDLAEALGGERRVALCRELTKLHEETWRGTLDDAVTRCEQIEPRGEYVVVLEGAPPPEEATDEDVLVALDAALASGMTRRDAAARVATRLQVPANRVKRLVNEIGNGRPG